MISEESVSEASRAAKADSVRRAVKSKQNRIKQGHARVDILMPNQESADVLKAVAKALKEGRGVTPGILPLDLLAGQRETLSTVAALLLDRTVAVLGRADALLLDRFERRLRLMEDVVGLSPPAVPDALLAAAYARLRQRSGP
jgi:hypothetical protein